MSQVPDFARLLGPSKITTSIKTVDALMQGPNIINSSNINNSSNVVVAPRPAALPTIPYLVPPPPPPPRSSFVVVEPGPFISPTCLAKNTFVLLILHLSEPGGCVTVKHVKEVIKQLAEFKQVLTNALDNERGLYKKFGFSRKRTLTMQGLKDMINAPDSDTDLKPELITYLGKYTEHNICLIRINGTLERTEYIADPLKPWVLIKEVHDKGYMLYTGTESISSVIVKELEHAGYLAKLATKKKSEINKLVKMVGSDSFLADYK
jgi:hypothetical protein